MIQSLGQFRFFTRLPNSYHTWAQTQTSPVKLNLIRSWSWSWPDPTQVECQLECQSLCWRLGGLLLVTSCEFQLQPPSAQTLTQVKLSWTTLMGFLHIDYVMRTICLNLDHKMREKKLNEVGRVGLGRSP